MNKKITALCLLLATVSFALVGMKSAQNTIRIKRKNVSESQQPKKKRKITYAPLPQESDFYIGTINNFYEKLDETSFDDFFTMVKLLEEIDPLAEYLSKMEDVSNPIKSINPPRDLSEKSFYAFLEAIRASQYEDVALKVYNPNITDKHLAKIFEAFSNERCEVKLKKIEISQATVTGACLNALRRTSDLKTLVLSHCTNLNEKSLKCLGRFTALSLLDLSQTPIVGFCFQHLRNVKELLVSSCKELREEALLLLAKAIKIETLDISDTNLRGRYQQRSEYGSSKTDVFPAKYFPRSMQIVYALGCPCLSAEFVEDLKDKGITISREYGRAQNSYCFISCPPDFSRRREITTELRGEEVRYNLLEDENYGDFLPSPYKNLKTWEGLFFSS